MCRLGSRKADDDNVVVAPRISSGLRRRKHAILGGAVVLTAINVVLRVALRSSTDTLRAAQRFCPSEDEPCTRSDQFGFQVASFVMQSYMGGAGFLAWCWTKRAHTAVPNTPEGRLFGYLEEADRLNGGIFLYQWWDFFASPFIPGNCTPVLMVHHFLAGLCSWFSLEHQMVHHYAVFFGGCSEISSVFLVLCEFDVYFPATDGTPWASFILFCQVCFTLNFFYFRIVAWWRVSFRLWADVLYVQKRNLLEQYRPGKGWFLYVFLLLDILLGGLQLYWFFFEISPKVMEILL